MSDVLTRYLLIGDDWENAIDDSRFYIEDDKIYTEEELDTDIQAQLRQIGYEIYNISEADFYGGIQALVHDKKRSEERRVGKGVDIDGGGISRRKVCSDA